MVEHDVHNRFSGQVVSFTVPVVFLKRLSWMWGDVRTIYGPRDGRVQEGVIRERIGLS